MDLSKYTPRRLSVAVPTADGSEPLDLYGLSFSDITFIVEQNRELIEAIYAMIVDPERAEPVTVDAVIAKALQDGPFLIAMIVAFGAQQSDAIEQAAGLPPMVQIEAVEKILRLTTEGDYGPKKLMETVGKVLGSAQGRRTPSVTGGEVPSTPA